MNREAALRSIGDSKGAWDVVVIGGGASGLGAALDATSRGYKTLLLEQADFAKGTSSRSTKLSHGGVRYLQQGNVALVLEALKERGRMLRNAPHLVRRQAFVIPAYAAWQIPFYGMGLKVYDAMSGKATLGRSSVIGAAAVSQALSSIVRKDLAGGVLYFDGQFDDARYCIALARTIDDLGGTAVNYMRVVRLRKDNGTVSGVVALDEESGAEWEIPARVVINATGVFTDEVRSMDEPEVAPILTVSQGSHFVLPKSFLPGDHALMVPRTADGRVLFAIPWHGAVVVGTTDEPVTAASLEPHALRTESTFLREHIKRYFGQYPKSDEILSLWSGLRPLVRKQGAKSTAALSREHTVLVSASHLVSVTGGKWTTYRRMGEDAVTIAGGVGGLAKRKSETAELRLHGWLEATNDEHTLSLHGSDQFAINALISAEPKLDAKLHARLPYQLAEVVWAARHEMARTVEDVLSRRTRALFLDARAATEAAPLVAAILSEELGRDVSWQERQISSFGSLAEGYIYREN